MVKNSPANAGDVRDVGVIPGLHCSRGLSCSDHVAIMHYSLGLSCNDHVATMYRSRE